MLMIINRDRFPNSQRLHDEMQNEKIFREHIPEGMFIYRIMSISSNPKTISEVLDF